jgi:hypothetical protein
MFTEDLSAFFSTEEFAESGVLDGVAHAGIFDNAYLEPLPGLASSEARFTCAVTATTAAATTASLLVLMGVTWRVRSKQPDATGRVVTLLLERQP